MGLFFSTQIIYLLIFVVYPSFRKWHTWGSQYELCQFFIGFRSLVTSQWKWQLEQNPMSRLSDLCNVHGWHWGMGKRPLLACSRNSGCWYKLLQIIENLSSHTNRFICDLLGMHAFERSYLRPLAGRLFYRLCLQGLCYRDKDASGASRDYGTVYQASMRPSASCTASITESGPSYKPRIAACHIKEITSMLCH